MSELYSQLSPRRRRSEVKCRSCDDGVWRGQVRSRVESRDLYRVSDSSVLPQYAPFCCESSRRLYGATRTTNAAQLRVGSIVVVL